MSRIKELEKLVQIEEGIQYYKDQIDELRWSNEFGMGLEFPGIKKGNDHDIEIYSKCIARLNQRFNKKIQNIYFRLDISLKY
jgi:hypothetical protein